MHRPDVGRMVTRGLIIVWLWVQRDQYGGLWLRQWSDSSGRLSRACRGCDRRHPWLRQMPQHVPAASGYFGPVRAATFPCTWSTISLLLMIQFPASGLRESWGRSCNNGDIRRLQSLGHIFLRDFPCYWAETGFPETGLSQTASTTTQSLSFACLLCAPRSREVTEVDRGPRRPSRQSCSPPITRLRKLSL